MKERSGPRLKKNGSSLEHPDGAGAGIRLLQQYEAIRAAALLRKGDGARHRQLWLTQRGVSAWMLLDMRQPGEGEAATATVKPGKRHNDELVVALASMLSERRRNP